MGKSDSRLTDIAAGGRSYGGICLLWHKNIAATPISGINSDRICGIRFTEDDRERSMMSVIGVYLPFLEQGVDCYREHLVELEQIVCESQLLGSIAVLGISMHIWGVRTVLGIRTCREHFCRQCWRDGNLVLSHWVLLGLYIPTVVGK